MMKIVFAVLAIVLCAMAEPQVEIPFKFCSMSAVGTANVSGYPTPFPLKMIRVKDTARYDIFGDEQMTQLVGSIISRPDLTDSSAFGESYFYMNNQQSHQCQYLSSSIGMFSTYSYMGKSDEGLYRFGLGSAAMMFANDEGIVSEEFDIMGFVTVSIKYNQVDYSYVHEKEDDAFSLVDDGCQSLASSATKAISSRFCLDLKLPEYMCSVNATGKINWGVDIPIKMYRVGDVVRFDVISPKAPGSVLIRSDFNDPKVFINEGDACSYDDIRYSLDAFKFVELDEDVEVFSCTDYFGNRFTLYFNHTDSRELFAEALELNQKLAWTIIYTNVNYKYVVDSPDDVFTLTNDDCPMAAAPAKFSKTSIQCSAAGHITPTYPGCAMTITATSDIGNATIFAMAKPSGFVYQKVIADGEIAQLVRCDIKSALHPGQCLAIEGSGKSCDEYWVYPDEGMGSVEYYGEPEVVGCPEGYSGECKMYCGKNYNYPCYTLNTDNVVTQVVQYYGDFALATNYTYDITNAPTLADFNGTRCDGTVLDAPTEDPCIPEPPSHSSVTPGPSPAPGPHQSSTNPSSGSFCIPSILVVVAVLFAMF